MEELKQMIVLTTQKEKPPNYVNNWDLKQKPRKANKEKHETDGDHF